MQTMSLKQKCSLYNINPRLEKHGEDGLVKAANLNVSFETDGEFLDLLAGEGEISDDGLNWDDFMFHEDGSVRILCVKGLEFDRDYTDHEVSVINGKDAKDVIATLALAKVCKISAKPIHGKRFEIRMQVQAKPSPAQMAKIYDVLGEDVRLHIKPPKQMDMVDEVSKKNKQD